MRRRKKNPGPLLIVGILAGVAALGAGAFVVVEQRKKAAAAAAGGTATPAQIAQAAAAAGVTVPQLTAAAAASGTTPAAIVTAANAAGVDVAAQLIAQQQGQAAVNPDPNQDQNDPGTTNGLGQLGAIARLGRLR